MLQRTESNRIGFLPTMAIREHIEKGWCITANLDGRVIGYVLGWHRMRYNPDIRPVTQLVVLRRFRRCGVARELIRQWATTAIRDGKTMLQAWTRVDLYQAHHFWRAMKWVKIAVRSPETARDKYAVLYRFSLTAIRSPRFNEIPRRGGWNARTIDAQAASPLAT